MVGNLNDMSFDQPFDYVVVNGVLEYAMSFTKGDTPYETFLENMGQYLNEAGKILIAIENKLGLKYFAGAPEDRAGSPFFWNQPISGESYGAHFFQNGIGRTVEQKWLSFSEVLLSLS